MDFYSTMIKIFAPPFRWLYRLKVTGIENIPQEKGLLICANHTSMMDIAVLMATMTRRVNIMGKKEVFKVPLLGRFFRAMGAFPVDRGGSDVGAIKKTVSIIEGGGAVIMFPQGTRCKRVAPSDTKVKSGAGMIAYRSGCDVLPIFIKSKNNHLHPFGKSELIIGKPVTQAELGFEDGGKKEYEYAANKIFSEICALGGYDFPANKE